MKAGICGSRTGAMLGVGGAKPAWLGPISMRPLAFSMKVWPEFTLL
jgi:hypothetical protein